MKKLNIRQFGIGTLMRCSPIVSSDSKYVLTIGDGCVYVWIVQTGQCLRLINNPANASDGHTIVAMAINPHNRLQLCVGQSNGHINVWDYEDGILIHTIELDVEIVQLHSISNETLYVFGKSVKNVYSLSRIDSIRHHSSPRLLSDKLPCSPSSISFDNKGTLCVFINGDGTIIYLFNLLSNQLKHINIKKQNLAFHDKVTCAQLHPTDQCLALGTHSGRIALWYNFADGTSKEPTASYLHWHSLPVLSLAFSVDGSYLLSGGHECVLVKWLYRTSEPTFRPRLGAPILHLTSSTDQTFYVSTHSDNTLHLISSNLTIQQTIGGINHIFLPQQESLPAGIHLFARQNAIVMNSGKPGYLQFMSIDNGKLLYNLDIVGENYVSPTELTAECLFTDIKRLCIDSTDTWLVTFEERSSRGSPDDLQNERKLTFWKFNVTDDQFQLNTSISYPHGQDTLNQMLFHPSKLELATTGNDGFVKVWTCIPSNPITKRAAHWRCLSGHTHRSLTSFALCYYPLSNQWHLASSFEHLVTVWIDQSTAESTEESRYDYLRCFAHFDRDNAVRSIHQGSETILVAHQTLVNLWNCSSGSFLRSFSWHVHAVAQDPRSSFIALFDRSFLHFYSFADGKCHSRKNSSFRRVTSASYLPKEKSSSFAPLQHSRLIFYIPQQGLKSFVDEDDDDDDGEAEGGENDSLSFNVSRDVSRDAGTTLANLIVQSQSGLKISRRDPLTRLDDFTEVNRRKMALNEQLLSTCAYLLPSIDDYCLEALKQMLLPVTDDSSQETLFPMNAREMDRRSSISVSVDSPEEME